MTTFLPLLTLLACGGDDAPPAARPPGPKPPAKAADAEAEAPPPAVDAPAVVTLRDDGDACAIATLARPDATPETVGTFPGPCPDAPTWVQHPDAARLLVTWGDRSLEIVDVDLDAGTVTRAPGLPGATVAAFMPAPVPEVPEEAEEAEEAEAPAGGDGEEEAAPAAPPPPPPDLVVAAQVIRTEARQDGKGSYFEVDGEQLRFDRNASLLYDTTVVRLQAVGDEGWERQATVLWLREEGAPARAAFPEDLGVRGQAHGPDEPQGAEASNAPDALKQLAEATWYTRDADGRTWAHALDIRDATRARTPVAVEVDGTWTMVEGLDAEGPLSWQRAGSWLLAWDGAKTHLVDLTDASVAGTVEGLATAAP